MDVVPLALPEGLSAEEVSVVIEHGALRMGLMMAIRSSLKSHPNMIHWHFRRPATTGTLEITYDPISRQAWFGIRHGRTKAWVLEAMNTLTAELHRNSKESEP
jgi:hypothetical protein